MQKVVNSLLLFWKPRQCSAVVTWLQRFLSFRTLHVFRVCANNKCLLDCIYLGSTKFLVRASFELAISVKSRITEPRAKKTCKNISSALDGRNRVSWKMKVVMSEYVLGTWRWRIVGKMKTWYVWLKQFSSFAPLWPHHKPIRAVNTFSW